MNKLLPILFFVLINFVSINAFSDTSYVGKKIMCTNTTKGYKTLHSYEFVSANKAMRKSYHESMSSIGAAFPLDMYATSREIHMGSYTVKGWGRYETILDRRTLKLNYVTVNDEVYMNCEVFKGSSKALDKLLTEQWKINRKNTQNKNKL